MFLVSGIWLGVIDFSLLFLFSSILRSNKLFLKEINCVSYYWYMVTILTFIWESGYIINYNETSKYAKYLKENSLHTWTNCYDLSYVIPWKTSKIYYAEYASYADREYCSFTDDWSKTVESSHAIFCGLFSLAAIICKIQCKNKHYLITASIAMGTQLMNSILYLVEYDIQTKDHNSINYNNSTFPTGIWLSKRPFMWINIFWIIMPTYTLFCLLNTKKNMYFVY